MSDRTCNARQFTEAVYRRLAFLRTIEQLGRGMLVGSLLATGLMGIAIWQSLPTGRILLFSGIIGLLLGIVLAVVHRPTRWQAIMETDRQLHFDELLATALSTGNSRGDFIAAVTAMADARCAHHSPSEVLIRRLGFRSWSAISLAMSVAITLAVIPVGAARSQASDADRSILSAKPVEFPPAGPASTFSPTATVNNQSSDTAFDDQKQIAPLPIDSKTQPGAAAVPSGSKTMTTDQSATGGGQSQSQTQFSAPLQLGEFASHAPNRTANSSAEVAGGGPSATAAGHVHADGGTVLFSHAPVNITQQGSGEPAAPSGADPSGDSRIPAEDREMVKEFFQR